MLRIVEFLKTKFFFADSAVKCFMSRKNWIYDSFVAFNLSVSHDHFLEINSLAKSQGASDFDDLC